MSDHPKVTGDNTRNAELIAAYDAAADPGPGFTAYVESLGFDPPERPSVLRWGLCVIGDDDGREWLAWDAEELQHPEIGEETDEQSG